MNRYIVLAALLAAPNLAWAQGVQPRTNVKDFKSGTSFNLLAAVALNAADAATRTITLSLGKDFGKALVHVFYTFGAGTAVTAILTCSSDGTNYARRTSRSTAAGVSTISPLSESYPTGSASSNFTIEYDVRGCESVKVLFGGTGVNGSDLVNVQATALTGG